MLTVKQAKELGVVFVEDWFIASNDILDRINELSNWDGLTVTSFTTRKHTGDEIPCDKNLPVSVELKDGDKICSLAGKFEWINEDTSFPIVAWKPDLEELEKLATKKEEKLMAQKQYTYELVRNLTPNEIAKAMIDGEVFYSFNGKDKYHWENGMFVNKDGDYVSTRRSLYRKKEIETITRTITYPKPVSYPLNEGDEYWVVGLTEVFALKWYNDAGDNKRLKQDCIHLTKENAQAHWDAIFGVK